jgi:hypothetical protein
LSSTTRFGNLGRVFKEGESELLIGIARLSVLYEDLRLELEELRRVDTKPEEERTAADQYRVMYFLRRALSTLIEFRGGLTTVRLTPEFKSASLSTMDDGYITRQTSTCSSSGRRSRTSATNSADTSNFPASGLQPSTFLTLLTR